MPRRSQSARSASCFLARSVFTHHDNRVGDQGIGDAAGPATDENAIAHRDIGNRDPGGGAQVLGSGRHAKEAGGVLKFDRHLRPGIGLEGDSPARCIDGLDGANRTHRFERRLAAPEWPARSGLPNMRTSSLLSSCCWGPSKGEPDLQFQLAVIRVLGEYRVSGARGLIGVAENRRRDIADDRTGIVCDW